MQRPPIRSTVGPKNKTYVLFFERNTLIFPVVHAELFHNEIAEVGEKLGKLTNAVFTGYTMSVDQWNSLVGEKNDPVEVIKVLMADMAEDALENPNAYGVM